MKGLKKLHKNFALLCLLISPFSALLIAQTYSITDLGTLSGFSSTYVSDNNNTGFATGCSDNSVLPTVPCTSNLPSDAFLWSRSEGMLDLGNLPGNDQSVGFEVNDSRVVVGYSGNLQAGTYQPFVWTKGKGMVQLPTLQGGSEFSFATAITSKGLIVGESEVSNGDVDAVIWTQSGGTYNVHDIGILPGAPYCYSYDINEKQQVTGIAYFDAAGTMYHGFLWSNSKGWKDLGTLPGGTHSKGNWMTDSGVVTGISDSAQYPNGVTVYWNAGKIHSIGTLPGGTSSSPGFISDTFQILGDSTVTGGDSHAFIWTQKTGMLDLNNMIPPNSGWVLHHASSIDKTGHIVGYGTINGANHGFLLTP